jgi:hypothetical protein
MPKITLVGSAHRANGFCNPEELIKVIRAIEPEVAFEEIRPSDFDSYCKHGIGFSLEAQAIARCLEFKAFHRVPVDRYFMPENRLAEIKREFDCVFEYVAQESREYQLLNEENDMCVYQYGFSYLNSVAFETVMTKIAKMEEMTIRETGNQVLIKALETWRYLIQAREREMIRVIYEYCRENVFNTGVFLVGAAHKMGITKEIEHYSSAEKDLIDWKLYL